MTQQAELYKRIDTLPQKYVNEAIDFVGYLELKAQKELELQKTAAKDTKGKIQITRKELDEMLKDCPHTLALSGILSGMGDIDLDEFRLKRLAKSRPKKRLKNFCKSSNPPR